MWDGFELVMCYDKAAQALVFRAEVPDNSWFSIGFGNSMKNTDMITWFVDNETGRTVDYWSTDREKPKEDVNQNLQDVFAPSYNRATGKMTFRTRRSLDTGDSAQDYLVPINESMPMIYAYKKGNSRWSKHDEYGVWSALVTDKGFVYDGGLDLTELLRNYDYEEHGWWMWGAWTLIGLLLLITKRYAKKYWLFMHYAHAILGYFVLLVTIIFAMKLIHWHTFETIHNAFGTFTLFFTIAGALTGSVTAGMMRLYNRDKPWAEKERIE